MTSPSSLPLVSMCTIFDDCSILARLRISDLHPKQPLYHWDVTSFSPHMGLLALGEGLRVLQVYQSVSIISRWSFKPDLVSFFFLPSGKNTRLPNTFHCFYTRMFKNLCNNYKPSHNLTEILILWLESITEKHDWNSGGKNNINN